MPTDTKLNQLIINQLTQEQYDEAKAAGTLSDTELYITDSDDDAQVKSNLSQTIDDSTTKYPSNKAVKDESSRIVSIMNNKVNKSGDTMTGSLIINGNIPAYILQDSTLDLSQNFTDNRNDSFILERDKNGKDGGLITFRHDKYGSNITEIVASNGIDENRKLFTMGIWCRKNGEHGTYAPQCGYDGSIVTTVSHGDNWIRFGNGLIIQWIYFLNTGATTWIFPTPFSNTNYAILSNASVWYNTANKQTTLIQITDTNFGDQDKFMSYYLLAIGY